MKIKDRYAQVVTKSYGELKEYFDVALCFDATENYQQVATRINKIRVNQNRVWVLLGRNRDENWECLQVAQKKNQLITEISQDVEYMLSNDYSKMVADIPISQRWYKSSTFYDKVYLIDSGHLEDRNECRKYSYSKMKEEYKHFMICFLKVDAYLDLCNYSAENENILNMIKIAKSLYAEAMIAYDMLARYWNMYNSGVDGQSIMIFLENKRNQDKN